MRRGKRYWRGVLRQAPWAVALGAVLALGFWWFMDATVRFAVLAGALTAVATALLPERSQTPTIDE